MNLLFRVVMPSKSLLPADDVVNTFAVVGDVSKLDEMTTAIANFYIGGSTPLSTWMSSNLHRGVDAAKIECYEVDLATGLTGSPLFVASFTLEAPAADEGLPNEIAVCSSFASTTAAGGVPARRRGRIYFGPLISGAVEQEGAADKPVVDSGFVDDLANATKVLADSLLDEGCELCVWSRVDNAMFPVVRGWVDNEFDIQRRRGQVASMRETWIAEGP